MQATVDRENEEEYVEGVVRTEDNLRRFKKII